MTDKAYALLMETLWALTEQEGLRALDYDRLSQKTGLSSVNLRQSFPHPSYFLLALVDEWIAHIHWPPPHNGTTKDYLFDGIMAVLDAAQEHRASITHLYDDIFLHPYALPWPPLLKGRALQLTHKILDHANIDTQGPLGWGKSSVMLLFSLWIFSVWRNDTTADLSMTMASLDQGLQRLDDLQQQLSI